MRRVPWPLAALLATLLMLAGCAGPGQQGEAVLQKPLSIATRMRVTTTDPAAVVDAGSQMYALNVYQRLMMVQPGSGILKTDAASNCWYIGETTYSCTLRKNMTFSNGNRLTTSDVKFSLERARRLAVPGSSARLLESIASIEVVDEIRIDFQLKQHDRSFGYALASPAASIVDEETFPADQTWPRSKPTVSSGPFYVDSVSLDEVQLHKYTRYQGATDSNIPEVTIKTFTTDELLERSVGTGSTGVLWQVGPPPAAASSKFVADTVPGAQVERLLWNPRSPQRSNAELRGWVRDATGPLRNSPSLIPAGVTQRSANFARSGGATPPSAPVRITVGYDSTVPGADATATNVAHAISTFQDRPSTVTATAVADAPEADIRVDQTPAWTNTALAWMQPWFEFPLAGEEQTNQRLVDEFRRTIALDDAQQAADRMQAKAFADATVLPLTQGDLVFYRSSALMLSREHLNHLGPAYQLAGWGWKW